MDNLGSQTVIIVGHEYNPEELVINTGTEVYFQNNDDDPHTVTADDNAFNSGEIEPGGAWSRLFRSKGNFDYHCEIHPKMHGRIIVEQAPLR